MRDAINNNPRVQMIVIGVMVILAAFFVFTKVLKKDETVPVDPAEANALAAEAGGVAPATGATSTPATGTDTASTDASSSATATDSATTDPAAATPAAPTGDPAAVAPTTPAAPAGDAAAGGADGLLPTKGLPKDVLIAYAKGDAIALLVVDPKAIADKKVEEYTNALKDKGGVEVFTVKAKDIAKYSRITQGVQVTRTPALVVIRPRKLTENVPTATVSYGFRSEKSVQQALKDALYDGPNVPSYP